MKIVIDYLFDYKRQSKEINWFKRALSLFILYKICVYIYLFQELFSYKRYIYHSVNHSGFLVDATWFLNNYYSKPLIVVFFVCLAAFPVLELFGKSNYVFRFLLWLIILNINNFLYTTHTGGEYVLNQLLLFNIFLTDKKYSNGIADQLTTVIHNIALIGIKVQVCLIYLVAALFKLTDVSWLNGSAVYTVFQIPQYSNQFLETLPYWLCAGITYLVLAYQLGFALFVWFKPLKKYVLTLGILQHLIIAFGMGIFGFGIVMILCYIPFFNFGSNTAYLKA